MRNVEDIKTKKCVEIYKKNCNFKMSEISQKLYEQKEFLELRLTFTKEVSDQLDG